VTTQTINVPEITCGHCKASIEGALTPLDGVQEATVDIPARQVSVTYDEEVVTLDAIVGAIEEQGYEVPA